MPHAVSRLRAACLSTSAARPYLDRDGARKERCAGCRLPPSHCLCALRPVVATRAGVCLVMGEFEAMKPSNTGWLVADVVPETFAFVWSRARAEPGLLDLLADPRWQPCVVFPGEFSAPARVVTGLRADEADSPSAPSTARRPLFVLLDGTWAQARKIFRKSPYLDALPVLSLQPDQPSRYRLRRSSHDHHFCTAEVAALCLSLAGDEQAARTLGAWLDVFSDRYLRARQSVAPDADDASHRRLREWRESPANACEHALVRAGAGR